MGMVLHSLRRPQLWSHYILIICAVCKVISWNLMARQASLRRDRELVHPVPSHPVDFLCRNKAFCPDFFVLVLLEKVWTQQRLFDHFNVKVDDCIIPFVAILCNTSKDRAKLSPADGELEYRKAADGESLMEDMIPCSCTNVL